MEKVLSIIPVFRNPGKFLKNAVNALANQSFLQTDILIVVDSQETLNKAEKAIVQNFNIEIKQTEDDEFAIVNMLNTAITENRDKYDYIIIAPEYTIAANDTVFHLVNQLQILKKMIAVPNVVQRKYRLGKYISTQKIFLNKDIKEIDIENFKEPEYTPISFVAIKTDIFQDSLFDSTFATLFFIDFCKLSLRKADIVYTDAYVFDHIDENLFGFNFRLQKWEGLYSEELARLKGKYR